MHQINLIATATFGLEAVVAEELRRLGYEPRIEDGGRVHFQGGALDICRANLWLRAADRVLIGMGAFPARSFEELFEGTRALPWPDWLPEEAEFPVVGKAVRSQLMSVPDCQAIVKKAVVEKMKLKYHREWFPETGPRYRIEVALLNDTASLTIDTSGAGLHKRGYRTLSAQAPLKETLAAAMIILARWHPERPLHDPFCGSGTIPIEAALIAQNVAPGIKRSYAARDWPQIPPPLWEEALTEAADLARPGQRLRVTGTDIDPAVLSLAGHHARQAGVGRDVVFRAEPVATVRPEAPSGCLICNPPYGERLGERAAVERIYREMGKNLRTWEGWSFYVLSAHPGFEGFFGRRADKRRKLYNGRIECQYYQYFGPRL
ncbi:MAG: THUMP domain-containing class I SAM-dependent RNA methyltransferase [Bacteroidota bacterium]